MIKLFLVMKETKNITKKNKIKLLIITFIIDLICIFILLTPREHILTLYDNIFLYLVLYAHIIFIFALFKNYYKLVDFFHYFLCVAILYGFFVQSIEIQILLLVILCLVQILWIWEEKCILNTLPENQSFFGYNKMLSSFTLLYAILFTARITAKYASRNDHHHQQSQLHENINV